MIALRVPAMDTLLSLQSPDLILGIDRVHAIDASIRKTVLEFLDLPVDLFDLRVLRGLKLIPGLDSLDHGLTIFLLLGPPGRRSVLGLLTGHRPTIAIIIDGPCHDDVHGVFLLPLKSTGLLVVAHTVVGHLERRITGTHPLAHEIVNGLIISDRRSTDSMHLGDLLTSLIDVPHHLSVARLELGGHTSLIIVPHNVIVWINAPGHLISRTGLIDHIAVHQIGGYLVPCSSTLRHGDLNIVPQLTWVFGRHDEHLKIFTSQHLGFLALMQREPRVLNACLSAHVDAIEHRMIHSGDNTLRIETSLVHHTEDRLLVIHQWVFATLVMLLLHVLPNDASLTLSKTGPIHPLINELEFLPHYRRTGNPRSVTKSRRNAHLLETIPHLLTTLPALTKSQGGAGLEI